MAFQDGNNLNVALTPNLRHSLSASRHGFSADILSKSGKRRNRPTQRSASRLEPDCTKLHPANFLPSQKRLRFRSRSRHNHSGCLFTNIQNTKRHWHPHRSAHPNSQPKYRWHLLDIWQPLRKRIASQLGACKSLSFGLQRISVTFDSQLGKGTPQRAKR
jgi:hypothetical protein